MAVSANEYFLLKFWIPLVKPIPTLASALLSDHYWPDPTCCSHHWILIWSEKSNTFQMSSRWGHFGRHYKNICPNLYYISFRDLISPKMKTKVKTDLQTPARVPGKGSRKGLGCLTSGWYAGKGFRKRFPERAREKSPRKESQKRFMSGMKLTKTN